MYSNPVVLGIDTKSSKIVTDESPQRMLQDLGSNTGNILFSEALYAIVTNATRFTYHFGTRELAPFDVVVLAAANWMNSYSDFGFLAQRIEQSKLPLVISGIGAQPSHGETYPTLKKGTLRLLQLASETSGGISVRGEYSMEVLERNGITNATVTGCPSLLLLGASSPRFNIYNELPTSEVAVHATRHLMNSTTDAVQKYLYTQALRQGTDLVLQSELIDFYFALGEKLDDLDLNSADRVLKEVYGEDPALVSEYLRKHGKVFSDLTQWLRYLESKRFCIGSRVHGTIASLIAGTPAMLVTHDRRTEEMALSMGLPYLADSTIDVEKDFDPMDYYHPNMMAGFDKTYSNYRNRFIDFFKQVGLPFNSDYRGPTSI